MSNFRLIQTAVAAQISSMLGSVLYKVDVPKDLLWETYINSFPEGTNPIFRERTEHDCQCCKGFIRRMGNVVTINENLEMVTIWDNIISDDTYGPVMKEMRELVLSGNIVRIFLNDQKHVGAQTTNSFNEETGKAESWNHLYTVLPDNYVERDSVRRNRIVGDATTNQQVIRRGFDELSLDAAETIIELIEQGSIYRGEEHLKSLQDWVHYKKFYDENTPSNENKAHYCWVMAYRSVRGRIRNTVIGSLLIDLSAGEDLESAVKKFEDKVAPHNYKRPTALVTPKMIQAAQVKAEELGIVEALPRRHATANDLTINNVLYADRSAKADMNVFETMAAETATKQDFSKVEEVTIDHFLTKILPKAETLELMFDNMHRNNLMNLIAPVHVDAESILQWDNNFTWCYNGELADTAIKDKVKAAGGGVDGPLRFSINWAEGDWAADESDLDAWAKEPDETRIGYSTQFMKQNNRRTDCSGQLDVDITSPGRRGHQNIVENIVWTDKNKMKPGVYTLWVNQFSARRSKGFKAEIEADGVIYSYEYNQAVRGNVSVAEVTLGKDGKFTLKHKLPVTSTAAQEVWGIHTNNFHKVNLMMMSPNHWDNNKKGNKHFFFILDNCINEDSTRGFFNEQLRHDLTEHRKVFEMLGSKMRVEPRGDQLAGLGFSSTRKDSVLCRVSGKFNRVIKINF